MTRYERLNSIISTIKSEKEVTIGTLSSQMDASDSTIRRDLDYLANAYPDINRTFGGASLKLSSTSNNSEVEVLFDIKLEYAKEEKIKIAQRASELIEENDTILLDSGSTCYYLALTLPKFNKLSVVTTDIKIAEFLSYQSNITTFIVGGEIRHSLFTIGSHFYESFLRNFAFDKAFMSCDALDWKSGITNMSFFEADIKKYIIESSERVILMADARKINKIAPYKVGSLEHISTLITNYQIPEDVKKALHPEIIQVYI